MLPQKCEAIRSGRRADTLPKITKIAFEEEWQMIGSRATNICLAPGQDMMTGHDLVPVEFRSFIQSLIELDNIGVVSGSVERKVMQSMAAV